MYHYRKDIKLDMEQKKEGLGKPPDQHRDGTTIFVPTRDLRYLEGSQKDTVNRAKQYVSASDNVHDTNIRIAGYLRDKGGFAEQDITRIQNFMYIIFQNKSDKEAFQGIEAIINMQYKKDAALETTIDWLAKGTPGKTSERERIEKQYKRFKEKKNTDEKVMDAIAGFRQHIGKRKSLATDDDYTRIKLEKAQKYIFEALETERHHNFRDIFEEKSEIPDDIDPAYALEEVFNLINEDFDSRTDIGEYRAKLRSLIN